MGLNPCLKRFQVSLVECPGCWRHFIQDWIAPEGFTNAVGEREAPKLAKVVNAVLIEKNSVFPEQVQVCGSKVWLAKMKSALSELDGCPLEVLSAMDGRRTEL